MESTNDQIEYTHKCGLYSDNYQGLNKRYPREEHVTRTWAGLPREVHYSEDKVTVVLSSAVVIGHPAQTIEIWCGDAQEAENTARMWATAWNLPLNNTLGFQRWIHESVSPVHDKMSTWCVVPLDYV